MKIKTLNDNFVLTICFGFAWLFFISVSIYNSTHQGVTVDEVPHFASSYSYNYGILLNNEHPILPKILGSFIIATTYKDIPPPEYFTNLKEQRENLPLTEGGYQYTLGQNLLSLNNYNIKQAFYTIRILFVILASLLIIYLAYQTIRTKFLQPTFSLPLAILIVTTPSFTSHAGLITFDTLGAFSLAVALIHSWIYLTNYNKFDIKQRWIQGFVLGITVSIALLTKYSNITLLPMLFIGMTYLLAINYNNLKNIKNILAVFSAQLGVFILLVAVLYGIAGHNTDTSKYDRIEPEILARLTDNNFFNIPVLKESFMYVRGASLSFSRSSDTSETFIDGRVQQINFLQFAGFLFWYKENPVFIIILIAILIYYIRLGIIALIQHKIIINKISRKNIKWLGLVPLITIAIYIYFGYKSHLTIGYRHFYPLLISIMIFVSIIIAPLLKYYTTRLISVCVTVMLAIASILGASQTLSYINPFWTRNKWELAGDSSINWAQEHIPMIEEMINEGILSKDTTKKILALNLFLSMDMHEALKFANSDIEGADIMYNEVDSLSEELLAKADLILIDTETLQKIEIKAQQGNKRLTELRESLSKMHIKKSRNNVVWLLDAKSSSR
jgi:hypothetical protein